MHGHSFVLGPNNVPGPSFRTPRHRFLGLYNHTVGPAQVAEDNLGQSVGHANGYQMFEWIPDSAPSSRPTKVSPSKR